VADSSPDDLIADLVKPGVAVSYHMGDGSTARARYPFPAGSDPMEGVENLLRDKRRTGSLLAVDSLDDLEEAGTDLYAVVQHIVAVTVQKGFDLIAAVG
jgi:hypothetical protein